MNLKPRDVAFFVMGAAVALLIVCVTSGGLDGVKQALLSARDAKSSSISATTTELPSLSTVTGINHGAQWRRRLLPFIDFRLADDSLCRNLFDVDTGITELSLTNSKVTGKSMPFVARQRRLKVLRLEETRIVDEDLKYLTALSNLEELYLDRTNISDEAVRTICGLPGLGKLSLSQTRVCDRALTLLSRTDLKNLDVSYTKVSDDAGVILSHFPALVGLSISCKFPNSAKLSEDSKLECLSLSDLDLKADELAGVSKLQRLRKLELKDCEIRPGALSSLTDIECLRELSLNGSRISPSGIQELGGLVELESVSLSSTNLSDDTLAEVIRYLPKLRSLSLEDVLVTPNGLKHLKLLSQLRVLRIRGIKDETVDWLRSYLPGVEVEVDGESDRDMRTPEKLDE